MKGEWRTVFNFIFSRWWLFVKSDTIQVTHTHTQTERERERERERAADLYWAASTPGFETKSTQFRSRGFITEPRDKYI